MQTTETKFKGYIARVNGANGQYTCRVINAGMGSKSREPLLKIRERIYVGMTGTSCRIVYRFGEPFWIKASKVTRISHR